MIFGITGNINKEQVCIILNQVANLFAKKDIEFYIDDSFKNRLDKSLSRHCTKFSNILKKVNFIISLGGDGTFLYTARKIGASGIPILGINAGNLGFMAEFSVKDLSELLKDILNENYRLSERVVLKTRLPGGKFFYSLNDIVIDRANSIRMIELEVDYSSNKVVKFVADGIILSTPTGSTGYSMSAGGPIITLDSKVFISTPICPHTLTVRPIIFPDNGEINIRVNKNVDVRVTSDGQEFKNFKAPAEFKITKADYSIKIIKRKRSNYFNTLNRKLFWGKDVRN
ncbi:MAG TPA: NAD(+)/NADH kinase [Ignavibacteria bacterium]|nr:NAD(+)/NADH kinase [Ignavibacteria bacterium]